MEPEQLPPTDEILILSFWAAVLPFWLNSSFGGVYRQKTGRVLKNTKKERSKCRRDCNMFLFLFALVLCVAIRTNVVFRVKKPLVLGGANEKLCGVQVFRVCSVAGRRNFQHW